MNEQIEQAPQIEQVDEAQTSLNNTRGHHAMSKASFAWEQLTDDDE